MDIDLSNLNRFMNRLLPMLLRRRFEKQRVEDWLQKSLKEYEAWGETQATVQERAAENQIKMQLLKVGAIGVKDMDRPLIELLSRLGEAGVTGPGIPTISPEAYGELKAPYAEMRPQFAEAMEAAEYPTQEQITAATRLYGSKWVDKWLQDLEKKKLEAERRRVQEMGFGVEKDKTALGWAELGVKEKELGVKKTEKKDKELLSALDKKERILTDQLKDFEEDLGVMVDDPKVMAKKKQVELIRKQKMSLLKRIMKKYKGLKSEKEYTEVAAGLKAKGYTSDNIEKHPDVIKKIKENGFEIWVLIGYL